MKFRVLAVIALEIGTFAVALTLLVPRPTAWQGGLPGQEWEPGPPPSPLEPTGPTTGRSDLYVAAQFSENSNQWGVVSNQLFDPVNKEERKKLTGDPRGLTNDTSFRVDGQLYAFGSEFPGQRWVRERGQLLKEAQIPAVLADRGWRSVMQNEIHRVRIDQQVQIVKGEQSGLYDTVLITYLLANLDREPHTVGLRLLVDTATEGMPFFVPPAEEAPARFVTTLEEIPQFKVPAFLRWIDSPKLTDGNTLVGELGIRLSGMETPEKVVICRRPSMDKTVANRPAIPWAWPLEPIGDEPPSNDSCVVLYWGDLRMSPKEQRKVGITLGVGPLLKPDEAVRSPAGQMRLFAGPVSLHKPFPVTALVRGQAGEAIKLRYSSGIVLAPGESAEKLIPEPCQAGYSQVTWMVLAKNDGAHDFRAFVPRIGTARLAVRAERSGGRILE